MRIQDADGGAQVVANQVHRFLQVTVMGDHNDDVVARAKAIDEEMAGEVTSDPFSSVIQTSNFGPRLGGWTSIRVPGRLLEWPRRRLTGGWC